MGKCVVCSYGGSNKKRKIVLHVAMEVLVRKCDIELRVALMSLETM